MYGVSVNVRVCGWGLSEWVWNYSRRATIVNAYYTWARRRGGKGGGCKKRTAWERGAVAVVL